MAPTSVRLLSDELHRGPWVYARQVASADGVEDGSLVEVLDASGRFLGHALYNGRSDVRLRFLARERKHTLARPAEFLHTRLRAADLLRRRTLALESVTDAYRVAHAEGDDLPGLIVDRLGSVLVCEHHALGFWKLRQAVEEALAQLYPGLSVLHRVPKSARRAEGFEPEPAAAPAGAVELDPIEIHEHGLGFLVRPGRGHKTGWFCDQRDNRLRVAELARGRDVLDLCTNAGGFALQAARHGARRVRAVDLDEEVLSLARASAERNGLAVEFLHDDAFDFLRAELAAGAKIRPEVVVLDPHKLIASRLNMEEGKRKYADLNTLALQVLRPGGLLATFSCSGALDLASFLGIVFGAARRAERGIRLLEVLGEAPDHPQRPDWPRSRYLKGALLAADP
jgi:23S rRNA (cytosine1962-C5)-methyltransferase